MIIDLGLGNADLYAGLTVSTVAGRSNLAHDPHDAIHVVGENIERILSRVPGADRRAVVLTGPMAVWAYIVVFHACVHRFDSVYYDDGRSGPVLVAQHGPRVHLQSQPSVD